MAFWFSYYFLLLPSLSKEQAQVPYSRHVCILLHIQLVLHTHRLQRGEEQRRSEREKLSVQRNCLICIAYRLVLANFFKVSSDSFYLGINSSLLVIGGAYFIVDNL